MGYVKTVVSGDFLEIYRYDKNLPERRSAHKKADRRRRRRPVARRKDNVGRLRKLFTRLVKANLVRPERPALLTLTMAQTVRIEPAFRIFSGFIRRMRFSYGSKWSYIAVPEFQMRGAVHFHVLAWGLPVESICTGYYEKKRFIHTCPDGKPCERRTRIYQGIWSRGFLDCLETDGSPKLAGYLAKYMSKAVQDERLFSQKAYVCSRNSLRPVSYSLGTVADEADILFGERVLTHKSEFDTMWLGRCVYESYDLLSNNQKSLE